MPTTRKQELNTLMNCFSLQIQRAVGEANNEKVLPQIQISFRSVNGQQPQKDGTYR